MPISDANLKQSLLNINKRRESHSKHATFTVGGRSSISIRDRSISLRVLSRYDKEQMFGTFTAPICNDIISSLEFILENLLLNFDISDIRVFNDLLTWKYSEFLKRMKKGNFEEYKYQKLVNKRHPNEIKLFIDIQNLIEFFELAEQQNFSDFHNELRDAITRNNYQQKLLQDNQKSLTQFVNFQEVMGSFKRVHFVKLQMAFLVEQINSNIEQRFVNLCRFSQENFHKHYTQELAKKSEEEHAALDIFSTNESVSHLSILYHLEYDIQDFSKRVSFYKKRYYHDMQELEEKTVSRTKFLQDLRASFEFQKKRRARFEIDLEILKEKYKDEEETESESSWHYAEGEEDEEGEALELEMT